MASADSFTPTGGSRFSRATNRLILQHDGATPMPSDAYDAAGNLTDSACQGRLGEASLQRKAFRFLFCLAGASRRLAGLEAYPT